MRRFDPANKYRGLPCSYVTACCAYESFHYGSRVPVMPDKLKQSGYLTLNDANKYFRNIVPIRKRTIFKKGERPRLEDFLKTNTQRCCVCVTGHFLYADGDVYWSFFDNADDEVISVWYIDS